MATIISNRYEIISSIGQGGMADVYKAQDTILNRIVAIKVLKQKLTSDAMTLVRFQREASAASRLSHPNVVDIYDVGEYEGMHYIVMEYVRGRTLKQLIQKRGALTVDEALFIMKQLTSAIKAAHDKNIIHRDIKPQNILMKDDGTAKITDFGIAVAGDSVQLTFNNAVMGSAHYLAPESAQGNDPNKQVDIYSLGIVFYELLTGDVPFKGKTPTEIALKHLRTPIPYVRDFNPSIPQAVENIVLKATAKDTKERYQNLNDMLYDLNHCLDEENKYVKRLTVNNNVYLNDDEIKSKQNHHISVNHKSRFIGIGIGIISVALIFLIMLASGFVRYDGVFGYETMPNVVDLSEEDAYETLKKEKFSLDNVSIKYVISDEYEKGKVVESSIQEGRIVKYNSRIVLKVSKGPSYLVEDYTGQYLTNVLSRLEQDHVSLDYTIEHKGQKDTIPGIILEQKGLKAGDRIDPEGNEKITFVVSEYPSIVIPTELIGMNVEEAKNKLNEMGIAVVTKPIVTNPISNLVVSVDPEVGSNYTQEGTDSVVTLYYN